jgi:hypothetical protein
MGFFSISTYNSVTHGTSIIICSKKQNMFAINSFISNHFLALILNNKFDLKRKSVDLICDTVQKLKYCDGVPDDNYEVDLNDYSHCQLLIHSP